MKKTFLFLCGLVLSLSAFAQTSVTVRHPHMIREAQKTIIKQRPGDYLATITCSNSEDAVTFIHSSYLMQATEVTLEGYWINDMIVTKDTVFFCGKQIENNRGIIGFFNIDSLFRNIRPAEIDFNFLAGEKGLPVYELTRMETFIDTLRVRHIFCIGTCGEGYPCLVDRYLPFGFYWAGYVNNDKECFTDVKLVADNAAETPYIATAGYDLRYGHYLNLRVYKANSVFATGGPQDWCNLYCNYGGPFAREWLDGGVLLTKINNNVFSTISFRSIVYNNAKEDPNNISKYIHLGFFDLNSIVLNSVYSMIDNYELRASGAEKQEMDQFIYSSKKDAFVFLYSDSLSGNNDYKNRFCEIFRSSLSTSGVLQGYRDLDSRLYGLSLYDYGYNSTYILSGYSIYNHTTLKYHMNTFGVLSDCVDPLEFSYDKKKTIDSWIFKNGFSNSLRRCDVRECGNNPEYLPLYIDCETE